MMHFVYIDNGPDLDEVFAKMASSSKKKTGKGKKVSANQLATSLADVL